MYIMFPLLADSENCCRQLRIGSLGQFGVKYNLLGTYAYHSEVGGQFVYKKSWKGLGIPF